MTRLAALRERAARWRATRPDGADTDVERAEQAAITAALWEPQSRTAGWAGER